MRTDVAGEAVVCVVHIDGYIRDQSEGGYDGGWVWGQQGGNGFSHVALDDVPKTAIDINRRGGR